MKLEINFSNVMPWIDKRLPVTDMLEKHGTKYPSPANLNYWWNFGSLAMIFFGLQIVTGIWLAMHYKPDAILAFASVEHIMRDVQWGWLLRYAHAIGVSFMFAAVYIHMFRGLYYGSYKAPRELLWIIGVLIYLVMTIIAFTGYLLPWGQMSFWGAQVITTMFSAIPVIGGTIVELLQGGFVVGDPTLNRFFSMHIVLLPGVLAGLVGLHIAALHQVGSGNPSGIDINKKRDGIPLHPYYSMKDGWFAMLIMSFFFLILFWAPQFLMEAENYLPANPLATPPHIVPEWYLLPFYAVLKAIPNKLGGVIAMGAAIVILFFMPLLDRSRIRSANNRPIYRVMFWVFVIDFIVLGYIARQAPEGIWIPLGQVTTFLYFAFFLSLPWVSKFEDKLAVRRGQEHLLDVGIDHNIEGAEAVAPMPAPAVAAMPTPAPTPPPPPAPAAQPAGHEGGMHERIIHLERRIEDMLNHAAKDDEPVAPPAPPVQPTQSDQGIGSNEPTPKKTNWFEERKRQQDEGGDQ